MKLPIEAKCACGSISFAWSAEPLAMYNCHCHGCQKMSGAPYIPLLVMPRDKLEMSGETKIIKSCVRDDAHPRRGYCPECGSALFACNDCSPGWILLYALTLNEPGIFVPIADIWTIHVQPWTWIVLHIPKMLKDPPLLGDNCV